MSTLNYTTTIAPAKTIGELTGMLAEHGASSIAIDYTDRRPTGIAFSLQTPTGTRMFDLPVRAHSVLKVLTEQKRKNSRTIATAEQAERVAWRVLKDWVAAQLAIIEAEMATLDQVMLPYLRTDSGVTLYEAFRARELRELES